MNPTNETRMASPDVDVLLLPFLRATTAEEEELLLVKLMDEHVNPIVRQILRHKLRWYDAADAGDPQSQDIEEAYHEIQLHLLERLRHFKNEPLTKSVVNLRSYVSTTTRNACDDYLRRRFPERRNLKDRIRYCLGSRAEFTLVDGPNKIRLSGLTLWAREGMFALPVNARTRTELMSSLTGSRWYPPHRSLELDDLLTAIFETVGVPLELDELTSIVSELVGVKEHRIASLDAENSLLSEQLPSRQVNQDAIVEHHQLLEQLWAEIRLLPRRQRVALLCNLKNERGINVITLFPVVRVATFEQIADVLEIPHDEFEILWCKLPIDDKELAEFLGITRQQTINLRRSARDRLMRRMKVLEGGRSS